MNYVRIQSIGLAVLGALMVLALAATSASALPEFGQCFVQPKHEGKYTDSVCTKKAKLVEKEGKKVPTGEFEWRKATEIEAAKKKFAGTGGTVELKGNYRVCSPSFGVRAQKCHEGEEEVTFVFFVQCKSEENQGEISGTNKVVNVNVTFRGCEFEGAGGGKCQSAATEGEIQLNKLKGQLGFINKKAIPREVGLRLEPAKAKSKFMTYKCNGTQLSWAVGMGNETEGCVYPLKLCGGDGIISAITPVNTSTSEFTQVFAFNAETAENIPNKFEGKPLKVLEGYLFNSEGATSMWSKVGESLTNSDKTPEAVEIKAN